MRVHARVPSPDPRCSTHHYCSTTSPHTLCCFAVPAGPPPANLDDADLDDSDLDSTWHGVPAMQTRLHPEVLGSNRGVPSSCSARSSSPSPPLPPLSPSSPPLPPYHLTDLGPTGSASACSTLAAAHLPSPSLLPLLPLPSPLSPGALAAAALGTLLPDAATSAAARGCGRRWRPREQLLVGVVRSHSPPVCEHSS